MSPRSEQFMDEARGRLAAARLAADAGFASSAVSAAYYAMLYAARAALSEEDRNAKTHRGTWNLFREAFVAAGGFDANLLRVAERGRSSERPPTTTLERSQRRKLPP